MLDPFTALSLASSVVQFVDFGKKLLRDAGEIYDSGTVLRNQDFDASTKALKEINAALQSRPRPDNSGKGPLSIAEQVSNPRSIDFCD
jgi:hypothetical protein